MSSVLIVGAGPAGLTLACELYRREISCRIIDEKALPTDLNISKALVIHAKTLEHLEQLGVVDEFLKQGLKLNGLEFSDESEKIAEFLLSAGGLSKYDFSICIPQGATEVILKEKLEQLGGKIERKVAFKSLTQDEVGVNVVLVHHSDDGETEENSTFEYVIGCDGAHSKIRHLLEIEFEGSQYDEHFLLADVVVDNVNWSPNFGHMFLSQQALLAIFPTPMRPNYYRIIIDNFEEEPKEQPTDPKAEFRHGIEANSKVTLERIQEEISSILPNAKVHSPGWLTAFRISKRLASKYQVGRVFLAGDAAHIHAPTGGQGMNTGMQDAFNLGWKLALVLHKISPRSLLDSYGLERRYAAQTVLQNTHGVTTLMTLKSSLAQKLRNRVMGFVSSFPVVQQKIGLNATMLGLNYRDSGSFIILDTSVGIFGSAAHMEPGKAFSNILLSDGTRLFDQLAFKDSQDTKHKLIVLMNTAEDLQEANQLIKGGNWK